MHGLDLLNIAETREYPLCICWASPGNPSKPHAFHYYSDWDQFISGFPLNKKIPQAISVKYERAQALYLMAWIRYDVIKAGELAAFAALELALRDRYWCEFQDKRKELLKKDKKSVPKYMLNGVNSFLSAGLRFMVDYDGLNDEKLQIYNKSGGSVIANFFSDDKEQNGTKRSDTLVSFRNSLAHGDPFDGLAIGSLLEIVRDLIEYMYRDH
ncbi:MAG: hypothetical protein KF839_10150 [Nitrosomonas sp.]|nr:hypothetical protein [Nitrosomonas sp.]